VPDKVSNTPWGSEVIWAETSGYDASLLYIKSGHKVPITGRGSYLVNRGRVKYHWDDGDGTGMRTVIMCTGEHVTTRSETNVTFEALECACIIKIIT